MSQSLLEAMRRNPVGDWTIKDIEKLCRHYKISCYPATGGGSHYKISHPDSPMILTIPYARPVRAIYIRKLVAFVEAHGVKP